MTVIAHLSDLHCDGAERSRERIERVMADVLNRHTDVVAIRTGHAHTAAATSFAGHPVRVAPGVDSTIPLPWEPEPTGHPLVDREAPLGLAFPLLNGRELTTHFRFLP